MEGLIDPIAEYDHDEGVSAVGGFVNRGELADQIAGSYLFGDYLGRLFYLTEDQIINQVTIENRLGGFGENVLGFGEGANGELFVMANQTGIPSGETGTVYAVRTAITEGSFDQFMQLAYLSFFGRPGDPGGLDFWVGRLTDSGGDLSALIDDFGNAPEFIDRFGALSDSELINNSSFGVQNRL